MFVKRFISCLLLLLFLTINIDSQTSLDSEIKELARQLNVWRTALGLGPLVYNPILERMALAQADFLLRLPSLPSDLHAGAGGENPRARSQLPEFSWPTYGHPELMSVTEIAAIGSIETAIDFWQHSDIHNRSVINPTYREIGIAAYPYGSDTMFIVVLGGRPDVLPVLLDLENDELYLTTEKVEWQGEWIGDVTEYRFLKEDEQPLTDWLEWERIIEMPEDLVDEMFFIEYSDSDENRADYELAFQPIWSSVALPEGMPVITATPTLAVGEVLPTGTPEPTISSSAFSTNTPVPTATIIPSPIPTLTPFPTFTPTPTPLPKHIILTYTDELFVLYNAGAEAIDLSESRFQREDISFVGHFWEEVSEGLNISALPSMQCLTIQAETDVIFEAPEQCVAVRSIVLEPDPRYFWLGDFEVLLYDEVVAVCDGDAETCEIILP